jgi:flagellar basal body rod protein FlgG
VNYGLYLSATGVLTNLHRQDVLANNLANVETVGFKPDIVASQDRLVGRLAGGDARFDPKLELERLGGGHLLHPTRTSLEQGALQATGGTLDLAIDGDGLFAVAAGRDGTGDVRLTRDGRFTLTADGELVTAGSAHRVLDVNDRPIRLDAAASLRIGRDGTIEQNGRTVARLKLVSSDARGLVKAGRNLFRATDGGPPAPEPASGTIRQGYVEASAVDPILTLNALISATKAAQANARLMQYHDHIMGQTINTFGRVA